LTTVELFSRLLNNCWFYSTLLYSLRESLLFFIEAASEIDFVEVTGGRA